MKQLTLDDVYFTIEVDYDDIPVRGNAVMSGNKDIDKDIEDDILDRLDDGDVWAWASVKVIGSYKGILKASDYLGACSYEDEEEFKQDGYYDDMRQSILDNLNDQLSHLEDRF
jgi:hypothetical protein